MNSLKTLIRLHKQTLDEKRRVLATLEGRRDGIIGEGEELERQVVEEQAFAKRTPEVQFAYGAFAHRVILTRESLAQRLREVEAEIEISGAEVAEAYAELKKYEIALSLRERRARAEAARRERYELDEIGLKMHHRRRAG